MLSAPACSPRPPWSQPPSSWAAVPLGAADGSAPTPHRVRTLLAVRLEQMHGGGTVSAPRTWRPLPDIPVSCCDLGKEQRHVLRPPHAAPCPPTEAHGTGCRKACGPLTLYPSCCSKLAALGGPHAKPGELCAPHPPHRTLADTQPAPARPPPPASPPEQATLLMCFPSSRSPALLADRVPEPPSSPRGTGTAAQGRRVPCLALVPGCSP